MKGFATAWILLFLTLGGRGTQEFTELAFERCFYGAALQLFYNPMGERRNVLNTCPLPICSASRPVTQTDTSLWFSIFGIVHEDRVSLEEMSLLIIPLFILLDSEEHMRNFSILSKTSFWFHKAASISLFNRLLPFMAMNQRSWRWKTPILAILSIPPALLRDNAGFCLTICIWVLYPVQF